ncbi:MAG: hypothetical protein WBA22_12825 [Candidatus Methanofastidiosia archaeon]
MSNRVEQEFKRLYNLIDKTAKEKGYEEIDGNIWDQLANETKRLESYYADNPINLYFIMHNYHSRLIWKMLKCENPQGAVEELKNSCIFISKRYRVKKYPDESLEKMSVTFCIKSQNIASYLKDHLQNLNYHCCVKWMQILLDNLEEIQKEIADEGSLAFFFDEWWFSVALAIEKAVLGFLNSFQITRNNKQQGNDLLDFAERLNSLISNCFGEQFRCPYVLSLGYAIEFRITKMFLFLHIKKVRFSGENESDFFKETERILKSLKESARKQYLNFKKYYRSIKSQLSRNEKETFEKWRLGCEIDERICGYFYALYVNKDVFDASNKLETLHEYIIDKALNERIPVSEYQLEYFSKELAFLSFFAELLLVNKDAMRVKRDYFSDENDWRNELLGEVKSKLDDIVSIFKYEPSDHVFAELKRITRSLTGGLPVYLITEWIKEIVQEKLLTDIELLDMNQSVELDNFLKCIKDTRDIREVSSYYKFPESSVSDPDVDILLGNSAVFIKNGYLSRDDQNSIFREIRYAVQNNVNSVFILVNFYRNMREINKMMDLRTKWKTQKVYVMDLKYVLKHLMGIFQRNKRWPYQGMKDILRMMDY